MIKNIINKLKINFLKRNKILYKNKIKIKKSKLNENLNIFIKFFN
jgi:hypothetical protein